MKVILKMTAALALIALSGCVGFGNQGVDEFSGEGLPEEVALCSGCAADQPLRGELMLFVNTRLSGVDANFTSNYPLDNDGRYVGNAMYLYDPQRTCDDGSSSCRVARLGNTWLDDRLGAVSLDDQSLQRFTIRELAWHPQHGLWGLSYDPLNDEWGLAKMDVPDWTRDDNRIGLDRYAFRYGPVSDTTTDDCYWRQSITGLEFIGDDLWAGSAGKPGNGLDARGAIFRIDPEFIKAPSHCVMATDVTADPVYYACTEICRVWTTFGEKTGVAGDLGEGRDGGMIALVRSEDVALLSASENALYDVPLASADLTPTPSGPVIADLPPGLDVDGLARIGGVLYGINTEGTVYRIDEASPDDGGGWTVSIHDELGPLFTAPDISLRVRGATRVVIDER